MTNYEQQECSIGLMNLIFSRDTLESVQAHVRTCQFCSDELQADFEGYQTFPELDNVPPGVEDAEEYLVATLLSVRHERERMGYIWDKLSDRISNGEVVEALGELFKWQYQLSQTANLTSLPKSVLEGSFNATRRRYESLRKLMDSDIFSFLLSGDPDTKDEELLHTFESGWRKLLGLEEESV